MPEVGVVSSIPFNGEILAGFMKGLDNAANLAPTNKKDNLGYAANNIDNALTALNRSGVDVIVTMGGLVTGKRAVLNAGKPFTVIVGDETDLPRPGTGYFRGGVTLQSVARNAGRIDDLVTNKHIDIKKLWLLANDKSAMKQKEFDAWKQKTGNENVKYLSVEQTLAAEDMRTIYDNAFKDINGEAVIVSADPNFLKTGDLLVAAANQWLQGAHKYVCYSIDDYRGHATPTLGKSVFRGPKLKAAYELLGESTKAVVLNLTAPGAFAVAVEEI